MGQRKAKYTGIQSSVIPSLPSGGGLPWNTGPEIGLPPPGSSVYQAEAPRMGDGRRTAGVTIWIAQ